MSFPFKAGGFNSATNTPVSSGSTVTKKVFKEGYGPREYPHWKGTSWLRILPAHQNSKFQLPYLKVPIVTRLGVDIVDPEFFNQRSLFKEVHKIMKASTDPTIVARRYEKDKNANGLRCWPRDYYISWVLGVEPVGTQLQMLVVGANDGSYGSAAELGHMITTEATRTNNDPSLPEAERGRPLYNDVTDIVAGNHLQIVKTGEGRASRYEPEFSRTQTNISELLKALPENESNMFIPLEDVLYCPSLDEQKELLINYMGAEFFYTLMPEFAPAANLQKPAAAIEQAPVAQLPPTTIVEAEIVTQKSEPTPAVSEAMPVGVKTPVVFDTGKLMTLVGSFREDSNSANTIALAEMLKVAEPSIRTMIAGALTTEQKEMLIAQQVQF